MIRRFIFRILLATLALAIFLVVSVGYYPEFYLTTDSGKTKADVIIVLGGGAQERPERAAELFKAGAAPRIIISGEGDDIINHKLLIAAGVPAQAIVLESKSRTTKENAELTVKLLRAGKIHSAIIVTSWYHSRRALKTFEHEAPELKFFSRPSYYAFEHENWKKLGISKRMRLEFLKLPGYWIRYGVNPF
jgi:uncharacterized SAM-binding protein YcdF (DUF218 family)